MSEETQEPQKDADEPTDDEAGERERAARAQVIARLARRPDPRARFGRGVPNRQVDPE